MDAEVTVRDVKALKTRSGTVRFVLVDDAGKDDAAPWLLGESPPKEGVDPDELFEKLQPFKELVAEDIESGGAENS